MNHKSKTTEFSAHLSRSKMGRYFQNQLTEKEKNEVELHLKHCEHCSGGILQYIQMEAPQNYKSYYKQLKGQLKSKETTNKRKLTKTHLKMLRATAALILLFVFSFFAIDTVMHKNMVNQSQPKNNVGAKKEVNLKRSNNSKEQDSDESNSTKPAVHMQDKTAALAIQDQSASSFSYSEKKPMAINKTTPVNTSDTPQKKSISSVTKSSDKEKTGAKPHVASNKEETVPVKETNVQDSQMEISQEEEDYEEEPVKQTLPKIEKLEIHKEDQPADNKMEIPSLPTPQEATQLLEK